MSSERTGATALHGPIAESLVHADRCRNQGQPAEAEAACRQVLESSQHGARLERLGRGPSAAIVYSNGPWVTGALFNNIWSFGGTRGPSGNGYGAFLFNPFAAYNLDDGWYISSSPNVLANWQFEGTKWTVPLGRGADRVFHIGDQPVDLLISAYYNVVKPEVGSRWQLSTQLTFNF